MIVGKNGTIVFDTQELRGRPSVLRFDGCRLRGKGLTWLPLIIRAKH